MKNKMCLICLFSFAIFGAMLFSACTTNDRKGLQPSTGGTNEIMVVTNEEGYWKGKMGQTIKEFFAQEVPGLPQPEAMYDMAHIPEDNLSKMLKIHHNVFIVDVNSKYDRPLMETQEDLWSSPQRVVKMTVPTMESFYEEFDKNKEAFLELFDANERRRVNLAYGVIEDFNITNVLQDYYHVDMLIPKSFYIASQTEDFIWLRREAERFSQGIMIYVYPYKDTISFNYDRIIGIRDSITKKYVPGPSDGSYMITSMIEPPGEKRFDFNGRFAVELRGMWETEGDFMGGAFVNYTMVDEPRNRVVTIDGYVYNPSQDKRDLVRQVESLIYTADFTEVDRQTAAIK